MALGTRHMLLTLVSREPQPPSGHALFLRVEMPEWFVLDAKADEGRVGWGFYGRHQFNRLEDGTYVCGGYGGSPTFIRCVARHQEEIDVLDGSGNRHTYRLRPHRPAGRPYCA